MIMKIIISIPCGILLYLLFAGALPAADESIESSETLIRSNKSWNGATLPHYPEGQPEITILKIRIPPGVRLPMHKHTVINAGVLLKGELTVTTNKGEVLKLKSGDPIIEIVGDWHYGENEGREPAEIIVFYAGSQGTPNTVEQQ